MSRGLSMTKFSGRACSSGPEPLKGDSRARRGKRGGFFSGVRLERGDNGDSDDDDGGVEVQSFTLTGVPTTDTFPLPDILSALEKRDQDDHKLFCRFEGRACLDTDKL